MHLRTRYRPYLIRMLDPVEATHLHTALRARGGGIILKDGEQRLFDLCCILVTESRLFRQLDVNTALEFIHAKVYAILHAHRVRAFLIAWLIVDTLRDLNARDGDRIEADGIMNRDGAAHTDGYAISIC